MARVSEMNQMPHDPRARTSTKVLPSQAFASTCIPWFWPPRFIMLPECMDTLAITQLQGSDEGVKNARIGLFPNQVVVAGQPMPFKSCKNDSNHKLGSNLPSEDDPLCNYSKYSAEVMKTSSGYYDTLYRSAFICPPFRYCCRGIPSTEMTSFTFRDVSFSQRLLQVLVVLGKPTISLKL